MFALGAGTLKDLALALFIGTIVGSYSSIFVASPVLALLKEREPQYRRIRARIGSTSRAAPVPAAPVPAAPVAADAVGDDGVRGPIPPPTPSVRGPGAQAMRVQRPAPRPRKKRSKGKRR